MWRVLANIYNNAAKYAMEGTRIYADLQTLDGKVIFSLKSISEQPFFLGRKNWLNDSSAATRHEVPEETGLGLSIEDVSHNDGWNI